ncbi:MAG TPA: UvrY/SirA/GacA family response regulator transcription factor [Gammaproteobacteria bacterium]|nr:UvrY/SirA/GacA family response regulator transcription factor [Gammaproteobacteria bacterium]
MLNLLLIDDHKLVRVGIRKILEESAGINVVGEAETGEDGLQLARELKPDIILLDINMPGIGGIEALRKLKAHNAKVRVIVVSVQTEEPLPSRMLEAGADGYLSKSRAADEVLLAVQKVQRGERYLSADIAQQMALNRHAQQSPVDQLSKREIQVLIQVTEGKTVQEISDSLALSPKTISTYRYRMYEKLNVNNDVELTRFALRHGLISE